IAAFGFALFATPGVGGSYWSTFFPAAAILGLGMAISVAPLTTTVMSAVAENRVGIASGVNNAVSRAAGLLAIAALGVVLVQVFDHSLDRRLAAVMLSPDVKHSIALQRGNLAAIVLPPQIAAATSAQVRRAIDDSFVQGFRSVMLIGAALAIGSAFTSLLLIRGKPLEHLR
ncbi:MAG TPA: MFS transporter, partial [Terriglobales bacterium]